MDLFAAAENLHAILGLLIAVCRGPPDDNQQVQHFPSACADGSYDDGASGTGRGRYAVDCDAVSDFSAHSSTLSPVVHETASSRDLLKVVALEADR